MAPMQIGICDELYINANAIKGSGGRPLNWTWVIHRVNSQGDMTNLTNATQIVSRANAANSGLGTAELRFGALDIPGGTILHFELTAKNYGGQLMHLVVDVVKLPRPAPRVLIDGPAIQQVMHSDEWVGRVFADIPILTCVEDNLDTNLMAFRWTELTGTYTGDLTPRNPRVLRLPPGSLRANTNYTFQAVIYMVTQPYYNNTVEIQVQVGIQPLVAMLGMSEFTVCWTICILSFL